MWCVRGPFLIWQMREERLPTIGRCVRSVGWGDWSPKSDPIETLEAAAEPAPAPAAAAAGDTSSESDLARATARDGA